MTNDTDAERKLRECLTELDRKDYYNGGQTVRARHPLGSESRARLIAEAAFWQAQIAAEVSR